MNPEKMEMRKTRNERRKWERERKDRSSFTLAGWKMSVKDRII
jgi:hypothetical protein